MTPEERYDLIDLLPDDMVIWTDDDELPHFGQWQVKQWMKALGHETLHTACCTSCGCATTCMADAFHEALIASVVRELDKLGLLAGPGLVVVSADDLHTAGDRLAEAIEEWAPEHACLRERADRKGYSHDEAAAEVYEKAIPVVTDALARCRAALPERTETDG